jgi:Flp pilus assembly protein TadG
MRWEGFRPRTGAAPGRPGQALMEFALVVSLIAVSLVGVVDFARVFYFDVVVSGAAAEGARASARGSPDDDVTAAARNSVPSSISSGLAVTVAPIASARTTGTAPVWTTVTVTYTVPPLTVLMNTMFNGGYVVNRSVSQWMRSPCQSATGTPC